MFRAWIVCLAMALPVAAAAQDVAFSGLRADTKAPVEVTADQLAVNQASGEALFTGNVVVNQAGLHMKSAKLRVVYGSGEAAKKISKLYASGGVTLASPAEAAESKDAVYDVTTGQLQMTGDVLLTQGNNVMSGQVLNVDMTSGVGHMQGRVRTILTPGATK